MEGDVVPGEYYCPRCHSLMYEKVPVDRMQIRKVVRFACKCGYYCDTTFTELGISVIGNAAHSE